MPLPFNPREVFKDEQPPPRHVPPTETAIDPVVAEDHPPSPRTPMRREEDERWSK
jgi:hypothetical protein